MFCGTYSFAQMGIGTTTPNPSTQLEIVANDRGILIPNVALTSETDQTTIANGNVESLLVYNTSTNGNLSTGYHYWADNKWNRLSTGEISAIIDNLTSASTTEPLSANQGRVLKALVDINTAKVGLTTAQATILGNTSGINTGDQDISGIATNASSISTLQTEQTTQNNAIALNTAKVGLTTAQATILGNTSGTNTGDQDISGIATNASSISTLQTEQTTQNDAIALNTAKVGLTTAQATVLGNTSGINTGDQDISGIADNATAIATKLDKTLADANLFVGNASNEATAVAVSGDATIANDGTLTIEDDAVDGTDISLAGEAVGDMAYFNGTDWVRLPKGTASQSLVMNSGATAPEWQSGGATEDVETVLATATGGYGTTIAIPANVSDYEYIRLETDNWDIASDEHAVHGTILVSDMASKRILIYADTVYYLHADINASGTSLTINCSGTATWRIVGIKAQKTVLDPSLTTVIDDDTFATASSSNVPSAESVKALVDNTVPTMVTHPTEEIRYIDIGDVRMQWGVITVNGDTQLFVYEMGNVTGSSLTATIMAPQGDTNVYVSHANLISTNQISFNVKANGSSTSATLRWMMIGPKP